MSCHIVKVFHVAGDDGGYSTMYVGVNGTPFVRRGALVMTIRQHAAVATGGDS